MAVESDSREKDDLHELTGISPEEMKQMEDRATGQHNVDREFDDITRRYNEQFTPRHREPLPDQLRKGEKSTNGAPGAIPQAAPAATATPGSNKMDTLLNGAGGALAGKAQGFLKKHGKKMIVGGAVGGVGLVGIVGMILFFIGLLSLPNYAENIAARQFAKVTRAAQVSMNNVMREKQAIASLTDEDHTRAKTKYERLKENTFGRLDRFRPNKVIQTLEGQKNIQYTYEKTRLGRERLVAISFSNDGGRTTQTVQINNPGFFDSRIHPIRTLQDRLSTQRQIAAALNEAMRTNNLKVPTTVRAVAVKNFMRNKLGVSLKGLVASRYLGKDTREARISIQQDSYATINDRQGANSFTNQDLKDAANEADDAQANCVRDRECAGKTVDNPGEAPKEVTDKIDAKLDPARLSAWQSAGNWIIGAINPLYDIALPVCMVYDGSRLAPENIDGRSNQVQRTAGMVLSTADQQRDGTAINGEAIGAMNWKLGDTNQSNALRAAQGEQVNTLATSSSTQAAPFGGYGEVTIFNVLLGDGAMAGSLNSISNDTCPTLTSPWFGVGLGVVNVAWMAVSGFFTGGGATAGQIAATQAGKEAARTAIQAMVRKTIETFTTRQGMKNLMRYTYREVQYWGAIELATLVAKALVGAHAFTGNGLAVGASFANDADNGANQLGSNMMRVNYGGRALTDAETLESMSADQRLLQSLNSEKSTFDRYFALDNPNSMLTHVGMSVNSSLNAGFAGSLLRQVSSVFNPLITLPKMFGSLNQQAVLANTSVQNMVYGNVQFDWSQGEYDAIQSNVSYQSPSENEYLLDERGDREKIEQEYGPCLDETIGVLLAEGWIKRDNETGNVLDDDSKCSPRNMGPNNPTYGDGVFRYRLFRFYNSTLTTLEGIENPAPSGTVQQQANATIPTGSAQDLAKQILASDNIRFQLPVQKTYMEHIAETGKAQQCGAPDIDPKLLGVILAISQKYKIVVGLLVDGHSCDGGFHPRGMAVDLNGVNPLNDWNGGTGNYITWAAGELEYLRPFYKDVGEILKQAGGGGMGEANCADGLAKAEGVTYFPDTCNHLHIDVGKR